MSYSLPVRSRFLKVYRWENSKARQTTAKALDYDAILRKLKLIKPDFDLSEDITIRTESLERPLVNVYGHLLVDKGKPEQHYYTTYDPADGSFSQEEKSTIGETLYRLHFPKETILFPLPIYSGL